MSSFALGAAFASFVWACVLWVMAVRALASELIKPNAPGEATD